MSTWQAPATGAHARERVSHLALKKRIEIKKRVTQFVPLLLTFPAVGLVFVFKIYPVFGTITTSFHEWNGFDPNMRFVDVQNYIRFFTSDELVPKAIANTTEFFVLTTIGVMGLGLFSALLVHLRIRGRAFFRTVIFMPVVMSMTAAAMLWSLMFDGTVGIINPILRLLQLDFLIFKWLADPRIAMVSVSIVSIWKSFPFMMVIFLAGLDTIDATLYEAAKIDGAGTIASFTHITLPLMKPFLAISFLLCTIGGFSAFDEPWILTRGGPLHATETVLTYMYRQAFIYFEMGYAGAITTVLMVFITILVLIQAKTTLKGEE